MPAIQQNSGKNKWTWLWIGLGILLLIVVLYFVFRPSSTKTVSSTYTSPPIGNSLPATVLPSIIPTPSSILGGTTSSSAPRPSLTTLISPNPLVNPLLNPLAGLGSSFGGLFGR